MLSSPLRPLARLLGPSCRLSSGRHFSATATTRAADDDDLVRCRFLERGDGADTLSPAGSRGVAVLTLNDPGRLNALTEPMGDCLQERVRQLNQQDGLGAAIVTGEGRAFSAGGDLDWLEERHRDTGDNNRAIMLDFYQRFLCLRQLKVPVIAVINGAAIGAGLCLAMGGCDVRIAHEKAQLGVTFVRLGLHPGMAATHFLPRLVGPSMAAEMLLTGKVVSAKEALDMGLVSRVSADPMKEAVSLADEICSAAPLAVKTCLESLRSQQDQAKTLKESMQRETEAQSLTYPTLDLKEGLDALREKRKPKFTGK